MSDQNNGGFVDIGPACFADGGFTVISYRGANYYRACNAFVAERPDGAQNFCVKRVGHGGTYHEDFFGNRRDSEEWAIAELSSDRNARAYGWEIGHGQELQPVVEASEDNPFKEPEWRKPIEENCYHTDLGWVKKDTE